MKIRDYMIVKTGSGTITVKKDHNTYKSTYSVSFFGVSASRMTCPNRTAAKAEFIRLMRLYSDLSLTQILKLK